MNILVLGGAKFIGRALVEAAISAGHQVTLFNRGKTNSDLFVDVEKLRGDRDGNLSALSGRSWDIAIDTCGYVPRIVRQSVEPLQDAVDRYLFISTLSVYKSSSQKIKEDHTLRTIEDEATEEVNAKTYGALKVLCENEVEKRFAGRSLHIRPGYVVGPHDPTDRFTYWALRAPQAGDALAPDPPERQMQIIDARDLAAWVIRSCENDYKGFFNAVGPASPLRFDELLRACVQVATEKNSTAANFVWVAESFLAQNDVGFGTDLPLCFPSPKDDSRALVFDSSKAIAAGLSFRPLAETISDTIEWANSRPADYQLRAGLSTEKEARLLSDWLKAKSNNSSKGHSL